jgi:uncharacterized protein YeaO (DUF488 family)
MARRQAEILRFYANRGGNGDQRAFIDRLWPRRNPARFAQFALRCREERASSPAKEAAARLRRHARRCTVTLLTAMRDAGHSGALVPCQVIDDHGQ